MTTTQRSRRIWEQLSPEIRSGYESDVTLSRRPKPEELRTIIIDNVVEDFTEQLDQQGEL